MWDPKVGQWEFVFVSDYSFGHHYFVYTISYTENELTTLNYSVDNMDLKLTTLEDEEDIEEQLYSTEVGVPALMSKRWLLDAASKFKTKEHFKYSGSYVKFVFDMISAQKEA